MNKIVIAIDGFSACGKSSTAKKVASRLGYKYIDSGAMYRAVTLYFVQHKIDLENQEEIKAALDNIDISFRVNAADGQTQTYLNDFNVESEIRKMYISGKVSEVSSIKAVRLAMVAQQQKLGKEKGVVMDGRDIGTVVFPEAELKIFMTADINVRAQRRQQELLQKDQQVELNEIIENLTSRDHLDTTRKESPLVQASDAVVVDTTHMTLEEQVDQIVKMGLSEMTLEND